MPRPKKKRIVADNPGYCLFLPADGSVYGEPVIMTVDEFEAVRLIDLAGLDQSGCAKQMNIARTTAQNIYNSARKKIASALVFGHELRIEGGDYILMDDNDADGCCRSVITIDRIGGKKDLRDPGEDNMKIAVTYDPSNGEIFQHYGWTEYFKVYEVEGDKIESNVYSTNGLQHGSLGGVLTGIGADVLICGGIGGGAQTALEQNGIRLFGGCSGSADQAVEDFLNDRLNYKEDELCEVHPHDDGEGCHE